MWKIAALPAVLLGLVFLMQPTANAALKLHGGVVQASGAGSYTGPCDLGVSCAEAWSVDQLMTASYHGALFQLALAANPTSTLDVYPTVSGATDMSTWSAFCGGVQTNCVYSKLYPQIHAGLAANTFVPYAFYGPHGPDCSAGGIACACAFQINAVSGLPQIPTSSVSPALQYCMYTLTGDGTAVGIMGGSGSDVSMVTVGFTYPNGVECCGHLNLAHSYNDPDTPGTDFGINYTYGTTSSYSNCVSANVYCMVSDLESNTGPSGASLGSSPLNGIAFLAWNHSVNILTGIANGHSSWTPQTPPVPMNPGTHIHLGGGGDMTPSTFNWYSGLVTNTDATPFEPAIRANIEHFFSTLAFP